MLSRIPRPNLFGLLTIHCLFWALCMYFISPELDLRYEMLEDYAWGQTFEWGNFKHPPLLGWVTAIWFSLLPTNNLTYYLLSYFNVALALLGIVKLAGLVQKTENKLGDQWLWWVLALSILAFPYGARAVTLNANTILLALWPWTAYFFISSIEFKNKAPYCTAFMLGLLAALSLLGKYFSGVLLLTLFLISLSNSSYRRWYFTPYPYTTLLILLSLLFPHVLWLVKMNFPCLHYIQGKCDAKWSLWKYVSFSVSWVYFFMLPWGLYIFFMRTRCGKKNRFSFSVKNDIASESIKTLVLLILLPVLISLGCSIFFHVRINDHFVYPAYFSLPILMAFGLTPLINEANTTLLWKMLLQFWLLCMIGVFSYLSFIAYTGERSGRFLANRDMARSIESAWREEFVDEKPFEWAAGDWKHAGALSFYLRSHPRAIPGAPDEWPAVLNPQVKWASQNGLFITSGKEMSLLAEKWLVEHHHPILKKEIDYHSTDWRDKKPLQRKVIVYWYFSKNSKPSTQQSEVKIVENAWLSTFSFY